MTAPALRVLHSGVLVGTIEVDAAGAMHFAYAPAWLAAPGAFALSVSLPLSTARYASEAHRFFANLLPEASVREAVARRLGLSADNDAALLAALGEECAGALQIVTAERGRAEPGYEPLRTQDLARWDLKGTALASAVADGEARLSLAGAQDKLPVFVDASGKLWLPRGGAPSTHLVKFGNPDYSRLPENEVLMTRLARELGLDVVDARLYRAGKSRLCLVARYDRRGAERGIERIHQEDFCQALGVPARSKYEAEGGPTFARCIELVREVSAEPARDVERLIDWQIFNALSGNCDGHAKNLSLLYSSGGVRLAPFYDLVCTRAYRDLSHRLAMNIGGGADAALLQRTHWVRFSQDIDVGARFVLPRVTAMAAALLDRAPSVIADLEHEHGGFGFGAELRRVWKKLATPAARMRP